MQYDENFYLSLQRKIANLNLLLGTFSLEKYVVKWYLRKMRAKT